MIRNLTRKSIVATDHTPCNTVWSQGLGLMFRKKIEVLLMEFRWPRRVALHMWFVRFPIDVIGLDEKKRVVAIKEDFRPFRHYTTEQPCKYVVEVPAGTVKDTKTKVGDQLSFR
jgi:uncharacterized membrane protein (UPF0127 family)